ncbi:MAG: molybdopterin molybdenumtransferase MoeA, partial [Elusimicrobiota bacterium]
MIDFKVALKTVLNESNRLSAETINVENSTGRFSAENISSKVDFPDFNNSAMDGFAIPAYLTKNATETSPVILPVKGEISAGDNPGKIRLTGPSVIKIFTGAPIPQGADAVIRHEETKTF